MTKYTRLASTVGQLSRFEDGLSLGHFVNPCYQKHVHRLGRSELTSDRASMGIVHAVYARSSSTMDPQISEDFDQLWKALSQRNKAKVDASMDAFTSIARRICEDSETSWFAGFILKEGELLAITKGAAVAYLYRNDAFYPLTPDNLNWPGKDAYGNPLKDYHAYRAGTQNDIHISNIVSVQQDDCLMLAPQRLMVELGQRTLLHLFDEVVDQEEAVQTILDRLGDSFQSNKQLLVSFVENIYDVSDDLKGKGRHKRSQEEVVLIAEAGELRPLERSDLTRVEAVEASIEPPEISADAPSPWTKPSVQREVIETKTFESVPDVLSLSEDKEPPAAPQEPLGAAINTQAEVTESNTQPEPEKESKKRLSERLESENIPQVDGSELIQRKSGPRPTETEREEDKHDAPKWPYLVIALLILLIIFLILNLLDRTGVLDLPFF